MEQIAAKIPRSGAGRQRDRDEREDEDMLMIMDLMCEEAREDQENFRLRSASENARRGARPRCTTN